MLGLYRAALLHTSISSDSLSSFPLLTFLSRPPAPILFPSFPSDIRGLPPLPPLSNLLCLFHLLLLHLLLRVCPLTPFPRLFHPSAQPLAYPLRLTYLKPLFPQPSSLILVLFSTPDTLPPSFSPPPPRFISLPVPLPLGLYLEILPPTNKPQTLYSFTQS